MEGTFWLALGLTLFAGLSTGIGSLLAFFCHRTNTRFLSLALGFSAGVMIYVSFVEIMRKANDALAADLGARTGGWVTIVAFFGGIFVAALIDRLVPCVENPHEMHTLEDMSEGALHVHHDKLMRMGVISALAIAVHNFPEGLATFVATLKSPSLGVPVAVAVAIHNIPEGIAVSVPVYYATGDRKKAFFYSFLSGLAEPVGALVGYFLFFKYFTNSVFGILFAGVAGIMVFISFDELLPSAEKYGEHHLMVYGLTAGMATMAVSLVLFL